MFKWMVYIGVGLKDGNSVNYLKFNFVRIIFLFLFFWLLFVGIVVNVKVVILLEGLCINLIFIKYRNGI